MSKNKKASRVSSETQSVRTSSVGWMINRTSKFMEAGMKKALSPLGVTLAQFTILMTLLEKDGLTQSQISKHLEMPEYAVTRNLDSLENKKLLKRFPDVNSRRSFNIRLTKTGRELAPNLYHPVCEVNMQVLKSLGESEKKALSQALSKVVAANLNTKA